MSNILFHEEEMTLTNALDTIAQCEDNNISLQEFQHLTNRYKKLLKQTQVLVRIGDKQQGNLVKATEKLQNEAENAIQANDQQLAQFLEAVSLGIFVVDANGHPYYANKRAQQILGKDIIANFGTKKSAETCSIYLAGTAQLYPRGQQAVYQALNGKISKIDDMEVHRNDNIIPIEVWGTPIFDEHGNIMYAIAAFQDITERKQMLEALQKSEEKYRSLVDNINIGIFRSSVDGKILSANNAIIQMLGFDSAEELMQLPTTSRYADPTQREILLSKLIEQGEVKNFEIDILRKDNSSVCVSISSVLVCDDKGEPLFLDSVVEDITERKQAEELTRRERDKAQTYLDVASVMFMAIDSKENVVLINRKGCEILEYSEAEIIGQNWFDNFLVTEDIAEVRGIFEKLMRGEIAAVEYYEKPIVAKSGKEKIIAWHNAIVKNENGQTIGTISSGEDITKRKRIEVELADERISLADKVQQRTAELSQANAELANAARLKDKFFANMTHELRTPLNGILGMADMLHEQFFGLLNEKQLSYVVIIGESGKLLLSIINDLLDTAKIDAGAMELIFEKANIKEIITTSVSLMKNQFKAKKLHIKTVIDPTLPTVILLDIKKCKQIMLNLLSNAFKYTATNGWIKVYAIYDSSMLKVIVSDNGMGIENNELENIFVEFYQADRIRDQELGGTGIGLALTRRLVELHGGEIGVESELEKGSSFWFTIPIKNQFQVTQNIQTEKSNTANYPSNRRILIAEDNEVNLMTVLDMLSVHNHQVAVAKNGQEAIDQAQTYKPELILMDIRMPVMNGMEAIKRLRAMPDFKDIPIIALTAITGKTAEKQQIIAGCTAHLSKPVVTNELFAILREYLR
jgi:PAS domain S-box-containing protein